jgi:HTH-type transcriptional regulator/antitoxin HigA
MAKGRGQRGIRQLSDHTDFAVEFGAITSESQLDGAQKELDKLLDKRRLSPDEQKRLEQLGDQIMAFEEEHYPVPPVSASQMLKYLIEDAKCVTTEAAAAGSGIDLATMRSYLSGKKKMSQAHKQSLARYFHVQPSVFECGGKDD